MSAENRERPASLAGRSHEIQLGVRIGPNRTIPEPARIALAAWRASHPEAVGGAARSAAGNFVGWAASRERTCCCCCCERSEPRPRHHVLAPHLRMVPFDEAVSRGLIVDPWLPSLEVAA